MLRKYIFSGAADFAPLVSGFISAIILTRRIGIVQWGIYSQVLWLVGVSGVILGFGLTYSTTRYLAQFSGERRMDELRKTIFFTGSLQLIGSLSGALILFALSADIVQWLQWNLPPHLLRIAAVGVVSVSLYQYSIFVLRGLQLFKRLALYSSLYAVAILVITMICYRWPQVEMLLLATYLAQLLMLPWMWRYITRSSPLDGTKLDFQLPVEWHGIIKFSLVIYLTILVDQIVWQRSEIFFLARLPDAGESGIYSLAYTVAFLGVGILPSAITGVLTPVFSKEVARSGMDQLRKSYQVNFTYLNWLTLPLAFGLIAFSPVLFSDFFGHQYPTASTVLFILIFSSMIAIYSRPSASLLHALKLPKILLCGSLCALPINLLLAWRYVPSLGAVGAAMANLISQAIAGSFAVIYAAFRFKVGYEWKPISQALIGAILCGFTAGIMVALIPIPILRLIVAATTGFLIYILVLFTLKEKIALRIVRNSFSTIKAYWIQLSPES